jgi:hypothetical protein
LDDISSSILKIKNFEEKRRIFIPKFKLYIIKFIKIKFFRDWGILGLSQYPPYKPPLPPQNMKFKYNKMKNKNLVEF